MKKEISFYYSNSFNKAWKKAGLTEVDKKDMEKNSMTLLPNKKII